MSNKQSSIDWIIELLEEYGINIEHLADEFAYAKMIHKDEILKAHARGEVTGFGRVNHPQFYADKTPENYYNETFGGNK